MIVGLAYHTTEPRVEADVTWGHPHGNVETSVFEPGTGSTGLPLADPVNLARIERQLDDLIAVLRTAIARGHPAP